MTIGPVGVTPVSPLAPLDTGAVSPGRVHEKPAGSHFTKVMEGLLERVNEPHVQADQALQDLITGKTEDVHNVVLSMVKADMSFRLVLELRNRLAEAYQEIMRMQV